MKLRINDRKVAALLVLGTVLALILLSNTFLLTERYRTLANSEAVFPAYKYQKWLTIQYPFLFDESRGEDVPDNAVEQLSNLFLQCGEVTSEVIFYDGWELGVGNASCTVGMMLSDGEPPHKLRKGTYDANAEGVYVGEGYEYLIEKKNGEEVIFRGGAYLPVLGRFRAKGGVSDEMLYAYFTTLGDEIQSTWLKERMISYASANRYITICVGSNEEEPSEAVAQLEAMVQQYSELSLAKVEANGEIPGEEVEENKLYVIIGEVLNAVVLCVAIVSIFQLTCLWMSRRRGEIAVLRAYGMSRGQIFGRVYNEIVSLVAISGLACATLEWVVLIVSGEYDVLSAMYSLLMAWLSVLVVVSLIVCVAFDRHMRGRLLDALRFE